MNTFENAQEAFEYFYNKISNEGEESCGTKRLLNVGFTIKNPIDREINTSWRVFKKNYAEYEWEWYLSGNKSVEEIKKKAKIWDTMHNGDNLVNSNYGYQWNRNNQLEKIINILSSNKDTRRAGITIYDGKEISDYEYDTPCTLDIFFNIINNKLNMSVLMRSNDLWFGFCNDQYCFSLLQSFVASKLNIEVGWYYHFAIDLHIYNNKLNKN